jgi:hypothetical protein
MATLREYYEIDFKYTLRMYIKFPIEGLDLDAALLYDFAGYSAFFSCYVPGRERNLDFFITLIQGRKYGPPQFKLDKVAFPHTRYFDDITFSMRTEPDLEIWARFHGDPVWISRQDLQASPRLFIYSESELTEDELLRLKEEGRKLGYDVQFRSDRYVMARSRNEVSLAFISHDSRDKDAVARKIAINLQERLCPVWYDEFSLKVGDNLRESIEKGLKECKKCILIISPNFLSNGGWTKKEFDSIFTREILEHQKLVLPVWYKVTKDAVYDYSPSLLNVRGVDWDLLGEEEVCRQLYQAIVE